MFLPPRFPPTGAGFFPDLLMITCQKPITDIAMELRFFNSSYFTAVFRRFNACSPSEYQKQKAEEHRL